MSRGYFAPGVVRRFIILMAILTVASFSVWGLIDAYTSAPPGDYEVREGDILLGDRKWEKAMERFNAALEVSPNHRGALMGRAIVFMKTERWDDAEAEFAYLIAYLNDTLEPDDFTGRGALAAAYANRGILHDLNNRHDQALDDYRRALQVDEGAVDGPGLFDKILYNTPKPSTIRDRAEYLERQLALPEDQRVLRVPERDAKERMYKP